MLAVSNYWYNPVQDWNDWKELATNFDQNDHGIILDRDSEFLTRAIVVPQLLFFSSISISIFLVNEINLFCWPLPRRMAYKSIGGCVPLAYALIGPIRNHWFRVIFVVWTLAQWSICRQFSRTCHVTQDPYAWRIQVGHGYRLVFFFGRWLG